MKIYFDEFMPYGNEFFSSLGEAIPFNGQNVTPEQIQDADALAVRSITKCDAALLHGCKHLAFVATATAGFNHLDTNYIEKRGIYWGNAAGCNAWSVADWFTSTVLVLADQDGLNLSGKTLGIVGVGQVGSKVKQRGEYLGMEVLCFDSPRAELEGQNGFSDFSDILSCDFISLHAPLNTTGNYQNYHLFDQQKLSALSANQYLLNAARGELVDNQSLLALFKQNKTLNVAFDVWQNEPDILWELVPFTRLATQHIAGHSLEGKARGTEMVYQQLCEYLNKPVELTLEGFLPQKNFAAIDFSLPLSQEEIFKRVTDIYDVRKDDSVFRKNIKTVDDFHSYRKSYPIRREFV